MPEAKKAGPEDFRSIVVQAVEHAAYAGAFKDLRADVRAQIQTSIDWLKDLDLAPKPAAGQPAEPCKDCNNKPARKKPTRRKKG